MKGLYNKNQIVFIKINEQKPSDDVKFYEQKRSFLGNISLEEGFYSSVLGRLIKFDDILDGMFINQKTIIVKSNIVLEFSSGREQIIYFNSNEEMYLHIKREFQEGFWKEV